jgi:ABC-type transport system involved in Fe-S cluster assembly fused permease/ATPase subunit
MKKSSRLGSFILCFTLLISLFTPKASYAQNFSSAEAKLESPSSLSSLKEVEVPEYEFLPATQEWTDYVADQKPAEFSNVKYSYTDKVIVINKNITDKRLSLYNGVKRS